MSSRSGYSPGEFLPLEPNERKRCLIIDLIGKDRTVSISPTITLCPSHIQFCYGAKGVRVVFTDNPIKDARAVFTSNLIIDLADWLDPSEPSPFDARFLGFYGKKIIGFRGPNGVPLYIILKRDCVL